MKLNLGALPSFRFCRTNTSMSLWLQHARTHARTHARPNGDRRTQPTGHDSHIRLAPRTTFPRHTSTHQIAVQARVMLACAHKGQCRAQNSCDTHGRCCVCVYVHGGHLAVTVPSLQVGEKGSWSTHFISLKALRYESKHLCQHSNEAGTSPPLFGFVPSSAGYSIVSPLIKVDTDSKRKVWRFF